MVSNIVLYASEVASICDLNPYRKAPEAFVNVWKRLNVDSNIETNDDRIANMIESIDISSKVDTLVAEATTAKNVCEVQESVANIESIIPKSRNPKINTVLRLVEDISMSETLEDANAMLQIIGNTLPELATIATKVDTIAEVNKIAKQIKAAIPATENISETDKQEMVKCIKSQINCAFGTKQEASAITQYETAKKATVGRKNDKFYKKQISDIDGYSIYVGGKVDGIKEDGTVIEVKNRMRRFFDPLPEYDVAQLQTYLFILDSKKGELVEQLKGSPPTLKTTELAVDTNLWNTVLEPRIIKFCKALIKLLSDPELQKRFNGGSAHDREQIISEL